MSEPMTDEVRRHNGTHHANSSGSASEELPDARGDLSPALTPRQLAFLALLAAILLTALRRLRRRRAG